MSDDRLPPPFAALVRALAGGTADENDQRTATFARGLALGALVGAAIAGSTIWQRRHARPGPMPTAGAGVRNAPGPTEGSPAVRT